MAEQSKRPVGITAEWSKARIFDPDVRRDERYFETQIFATPFGSYELRRVGDEAPAQPVLFSSNSLPMVQGVQEFIYRLVENRVPEFWITCNAEAGHEMRRRMQRFMDATLKYSDEIEACIGYGWV